MLKWLASISSSNFLLLALKAGQAGMTSCNSHVLLGSHKSKDGDRAEPIPIFFLNLEVQRQLVRKGLILENFVTTF